MSLYHLFTYVASSLMCFGYFIEVMIKDSIPGWYYTPGIKKKQKYRLWQLFGVANLSIGITALILCKPINDVGYTLQEDILKMGVFIYMLSAFLCLTILRLNPPNEREKILGPIFGILAGLIIVDVIYNRFQFKI
mmetsp:Transcript_39562/g.48960  ORF Transcript_39562/g.48960 Transcript_39562/m.48960 type:complete len:135 (-) Transcript_39562:73-477(-)